jgi:hypothetical protein
MTEKSEEGLYLTTVKMDRNENGGCMDQFAI